MQLNEAFARFVAVAGLGAVGLDEEDEFAILVDPVGQGARGSSISVRRRMRGSS